MFRKKSKMSSRTSIEIKRSYSLYLDEKSTRFTWLKTYFQKFYPYLKRKHQERFTIMYIPHDERKIKNLHISKLVLSIILGGFTLSLTFGALMIIRYTSTIQKIEILQTSRKDMELQFQKLKEEVSSISNLHSYVKQNIYALYSLSGNLLDNLFSVGGVSTEEINPSLSTDTKPDSFFDFLFQDISSAEEIPEEVFLLNKVLYEMELLKEPLQAIQKYIQKNQNILHHAPKLWPVLGSIVNSYGDQINSVFLSKDFHQGVDIRTLENSPVVVTADGVVSSIVLDSTRGWGVFVRHRYGYLTVYYGMSLIRVEEGQELKMGDLLGYVGVRAQSLEPIIHYRVVVGIEPQDPEKYLGLLSE